MTDSNSPGSAASAQRRNGAGDAEAAAPVGPAGEEPFIPDHDPNDNLLDVVKEALARNRAPQAGSREVEPPGARAHEPGEEDDTGQEREPDVPAGDYIAPPPAHYMPGHVVAALQQPEQPVRNEQQAEDPLPRFDHAKALEFYKAIRPNGLVLGYREGRPVRDANEFEQIAKEADGRDEHFSLL